MCNPNGVVSSDYLEGLAAADGPTGDEIGTMCSGLGSTPAEKASPTEGTPVWGGALAQRIKMALGNKPLPPYPVLA